MTLNKVWAGSALLLALAACNSGPPTEATLKMRAERECRDKPFPENTPIFNYCVDQELAKYKRTDDARRLYEFDDPQPADDNGALTALPATAGQSLIH